MDLDNTAAFKQIDTQGMLAEIAGLPGQLESAWELGQAQPLPAWEGLERVVIAGMGGSAIGADLLLAHAVSHCPVPVTVHRNYGLPAWARGTGTLVIASSHSGNTEETLSAFERAVASGCRVLAISTGGKLREAAESAGAAAWQFSHAGQPRSAVGFSFGLLMAAFTRLGLLPDPAAELQEAIRVMQEQQTGLGPNQPVVTNLAKRMAGQLVGRWVAVIGADILEPVARRWKGQLNEVAKAWGQFDALPEADHNTIAGSMNPGEVLEHTLVIFLRAPSYHPSNLLRANLTKKALMLEGLNTDYIDAQGEGPLAHMWTALHLGDYIAYYLAMAYGVDPTPIEAIQGFKTDLQAARSSK
jgi:glucose/mannose-6-phosphate isomerase